jgi:peptide/nickel transport system permease protein
MLRAPSREHLFGTDQFGRDVFSRVAYGGRVILLVGLLATVCSVGLGMLVGLCSGYIGGWVDEITMRLMDGAMAIPGLLLALLILTTLGAGLLNLVVGITVVFIPRVARVVRSGVLGIRELGYVEAARLRGESTGYILGREILPNIWDILVVMRSSSEPRSGSSGSVFSRPLQTGD